MNLDSSTVEASISVSSEVLIPFWLSLTSAIFAVAKSSTVNTQSLMQLPGNNTRRIQGESSARSARANQLAIILLMSNHINPSPGPGPGQPKTRRTLNRDHQTKVNEAASVEVKLLEFLTLAVELMKYAAYFQQHRHIYIHIYMYI